MINDKYKKGTKIEIAENIAVVTSDLIKFKEYYAIYADIVENKNDRILCATYKLDDKLALIVRDKKRLLEIRFYTRRKKSNVLSWIRTLF